MSFGRSLRPRAAPAMSHADHIFAVSNSSCRIVAITPCPLMYCRPSTKNSESDPR